ncbi:MAG: family 78 glycoside hydrolase catalytic domain, partial [Eubacteriales bacterium]|nr:family 78 glycoside hydrolase catalytic domain [Eubacteriales bacterium]
NHHVQYQEYDVTDMIQGDCEIEVACGKGWALSAIGDIATSVYTDHISCIYSLDIEYQDGETCCVISDKNTKVYSSQVLYSEIYHGEIIDKSRQKQFLCMAQEEDIAVKIVPQLGETVCEMERVRPVRVITTPAGEKVVDFGQNMTGYVVCKVHGKKGDVVKFRHGEVLDKDGNFYNANLRSAKATAHYIMGSDYEELKPVFTFYGFRYICVDEFPSDVRAECFEAVEVHSNIKRTGNFVCGHEGLNKLYSNIIWGQKDNFLDIPTDCPQRDERAGWTGDAAAFVRTAAINFDVERFFEKWLYDMRSLQAPSGAIPAVIPNCMGNQPVSAAWGDAAVICPWEIYRAYGNKKILLDNFECMKNWVEYMHNFGDEEYLWIGGEHFGDWLGLDAYEGSYVGSTDKDLIASCFFAYSTGLLVKAGKAIGKDMHEYEYMYKRIKQEINKRFMKDGLPISRTQTACVLLLRFGLAEEPSKVSKLLCSLIRENGGHLTTGFVGTPHLLHALSDTSCVKEAYDLLLREEYPSWLYSVNKGATTIWEHWDGIKEDGSFWSEDMNSFNHYAYGAVFDWIFENVGGIKIKEGGEGYSKIIVAPKPDIRLIFSDTSINTRKGMLRSAWRFFDDYIRYEISIPPETKAQIILVDGKTYHVCGGDYVFYTT